MKKISTIPALTAVFLVLALALSVLLSGCMTYVQAVDAETLQEDGHKDSAIAESKSAYIKKEITVPGEVIATTSWHGVVYMAVRQGEKSIVVSLSSPDKPLYAAPEGEWVNALAANEKGFWMLAGDNEVRQISYEGETIHQEKLPAPSGVGWYRSLAVDTENNVFALSENEMVILHPDGSLTTLPLENESGMRVIRSGDGGILLMTYSGSFTWLLTPVYPENGELASAYQIEIKNMNLTPYSGTEEYQVTMIGNDGLYGLDYQGNICTIATWAESQLTVEGISALEPLGGDAFFAVDEAGAFTLTKQGGESASRKSTIKLAVFGSTNYSQAIAKFNYSSKEYYVETVDYCAGGRSLSDAVELLSEQLRSGTGPDIISFNGNISSAQYAARGQLVNLYAMMDADSEFSRNDVVLTSLMEQDNGLYALGMDFGIWTWAGLNAVFGDRNGWTYEEYLEMEASLPGDSYMFFVTPEGNDTVWEAVLPYSLSGIYSSALDWSRNTCNFESPAFAKILEITAKAVEKNHLVTSSEEFVKLMGDGKCILTSVYINSPEDIAIAERTLGQGLSFIGWPTADGNSGGRIHFNESFAIVENSKQAEAVWELIKYVFRSDRSDSYFMSTNKKALEKRVQSIFAMEMTPEEVQSYIDRFYALMNESTIKDDFDVNINSIIFEEAGPFFDGTRSAEDVAKSIQSRAQSYMSSQ